MLFLKSTDDFTLNGVSYPEFPLVLDDSMNIMPEVLKFLIYECITRGRVDSKHTWWSYGQAMYDYMGFLEAQELEWTSFEYDQDHSIIAAYRDWSIKDLKLKSNTVNYRLRVIIRFYNYAYKKQWINNLPYDLEEVIVSKSQGFFAHTDRTGGKKSIPDVMLKSKQPVLHILTKEQIHLLLNALTNPSLHLIVKMGLQTGMRKSEILTFPVKYIHNPTHNTKSKAMIRVQLNSQDMIVKGKKDREIDIPRKLMEQLWEYVIHDRNQNILNNNTPEPATLFVNRFGRPYSRGSSLNTMLKDLNLSFHLYPHIFRHSYATHSLYHMREKGTKSDPLLYIKERLGHSSINTTIKYLHYLSDVEDDLITAYQEEIDAISIMDETYG